MNKMPAVGTCQCVHKFIEVVKHHSLSSGLRVSDPVCNSFYEFLVFAPEHDIEESVLFEECWSRFDIIREFLLEWFECSVVLCRFSREWEECILDGRHSYKRSAIKLIAVGLLDKVKFSVSRIVPIVPYRVHVLNRIRGTLREGDTLVMYIRFYWHVLIEECLACFRTEEV